MGQKVSNSGFFLKFIVIVTLLSFTVLFQKSSIDAQIQESDSGSISALTSTSSYDPTVHSDWKLSNDIHNHGDFVLAENVRLDLNGYNLVVDGALVLLPGSQIRAERGTITAGSIVQKNESTINLNNSQLIVEDTFEQHGTVRVNGGYRTTNDEEVIVKGELIQGSQGHIDLNGFKLKAHNDVQQAGRVDVRGGTFEVNRDLTQQGRFNVSQGSLKVTRDLIINGGPLVDDAFNENRSLNVGGGTLEVGRDVEQRSGQLYVNKGKVFINGHYTIEDGWLTMIHGARVFRNDEPTLQHGTITNTQIDFVEVHGDFTMKSERNHKERLYTHISEPKNDVAHLTAGVLKIGGDFRQVGNGEHHNRISDKQLGYTNNFSRYSFAATNEHRVVLTGKGTVEIQGSGSRFNVLEVEGSISDYQFVGTVLWNHLIESTKSSNANLASIAIDKVPLANFNPSQLNYHIYINNPGQHHPSNLLLVDAVAEDHRNATVEVDGRTVRPDGTATVSILVTAVDGTRKQYTINVSGATGSEQVSGVDLDRSKITFIQYSDGYFSHDFITLQAFVQPVTAINRRVTWRSSDGKVATVNANGVVRPVGQGTATITVTTEDGGFRAAVNIEVLAPDENLANIRTLADLVANQARFNNILSLYNPSQIGIIVPGRYIQEVNINSRTNLFVTLATEADDVVASVDVIIDGIPYSALRSEDTFTLIHFGLTDGRYIEVVARNSAGNELERISTVAPISYKPSTVIAPENIGFVRLSTLLNNPILFNQILDEYKLDQLRFVYHAGDGDFDPIDPIDPVDPVDPDPGTDGEIGTYNIEEVTMFSSSFTMNVTDLSEATHYNLFRNGSPLDNTILTVNQAFTTLPNMFNDLSILEVVFYSDADGTNEVARASLDEDGNLIKQ